MALRVLTLNLWAKRGTWTDRRQIIAKTLQALDPDLMAFQEAVKNESAVLAGDLDATPEAASIRFLEGLQSLDGMSMCYRDAWGFMHPGDLGHTFTLHNPLMMDDSDIRQEVSRRIDHIFVRCDDHGPTLPIKACDLVFDQPVDGIWASNHFGLVADLEDMR